MENKDIIERLNDLIQLDYDAVKAYESAIERIDVVAIKQELEQFKRDHERHIVDLSDAVRGLGGEPQELGRDIKGALLEGMTALRSAFGNKQALEAMRQNEQVTNKSYEEALSLDLPLQVKEIVTKNREDERRHLEYIVGALRQLEQATEAEPGEPTRPLV